MAARPVPLVAGSFSDRSRRVAMAVAFVVLAAPSAALPQRIVRGAPRCTDGGVWEDGHCHAPCGEHAVWRDQQCVCDETAPHMNRDTHACEPCPGGGHWDGTQCTPGTDPDAWLPEDAHLRVIDARTGSPLAVTVDGAPSGLFASIAPDSAAGYVHLTPGVHQFTLRTLGPPAPAPASASTPTLEANRAYTVIVHPTGQAGVPLTVGFTSDDSPQPAPAQAHVRFFNAVPGAPTVDVCLPGRDPHAADLPIFIDAAFGAWAAPSSTGAGRYTAFPAGSTITLQFRQRNARPCTGRITGSFALAPAPLGVLTVIAVAGDAARHANIPAVLVCDDPPATRRPSCRRIQATVGRAARH